MVMVITTLLSLCPHGVLPDVNSHSQGASADTEVKGVTQRPREAWRDANITVIGDTEPRTAADPAAHPQEWGTTPSGERWEELGLEGVASGNEMVQPPRKR